MLTLVAIRCSFCSKQRPSFRVYRLTPGQVICDHCLDWHFHALEFLAGGVARGCQECQTSWAVLRDSTASVEVRMYVVPKDGIYQLLCATCVQRYLPKRSDLYKGTQFGSETLKLL